MTRYLVTAWDGETKVRECWRETKESMTGAELYSDQLRALFPGYQYTVRPVTSEEVSQRLSS